MIRHFSFSAPRLRHRSLNRIGIWIGSALALNIGLLKVPCTAQESRQFLHPGVQQANVSPVAALLPEAARSAPPAWVKPGLRLTFSTAVASVPGHGKEWRLDPHGEAVDSEGHHWTGSEKLGIGGNGCQQFDVVAMEGRKVAIVNTSYLYVVQEPLAPVSQEGIQGPASTGGDLWINPAVLKQLGDGVHGGAQVYRAPYKLGDTNRAAVWIHNGNRAGSTSYVYDQSTGVMLHFSSISYTKGSPIIGPGETENTGNILLAQTTLADQRMLNLPWMHDHLSEWTSHVSQMHFQGNLITGNPNATIAPVQQPFTETLTPKEHGADWALFTIAIQAGQYPVSGQHYLVSGAAQIGGLWISPQSLAALRPGQELDRDPVTKFVTRVGKAGRMQDGREVVVISIVGNGFDIACTYDRSQGTLLSYQQTERHSYVTKRTQLVLTSSH